jgi:hypothetical protein
MTGVIVFFLLLLPFAWSQLNYFHYPVDDGFILAYLWRMYNGEVPYVEFLYRKPPMTLFLHFYSMFLPHEIIFKFLRLEWFFQVGISVILPIYVIFKDKFLNISKSCLLFIGFLSYVFVINDMTPLPWYTSDGVLFCSLAVSLFLHNGRSQRIIFIVASLSMLAVLCKQNFVFMHIVFGLCIIWCNQSRWFMTFMIFVFGSLGALGFVSMILLLTGSLEESYQQVISVSTGTNFVKFGVLPFFKVNNLYLGGSAVLISFVLKKMSNKIKILYPLFLVLLLVCALREFLFAESMIQFGQNLFFVGHGVLLGYMGASRKDLDREKWLFLCLLTLLSFALGFSSSISYGYPNPLLGSIFLVPSLFITFPFDVFRKEVSKGFMWAMSIVLSIFLLHLSYFTRLADPMMDEHALNATFDLGEIFPAYGKLYTNSDTYTRLKNIKNASDWALKEYKKPIVMVPEFPLYYFLTKQINPFTVDHWLEEEHYYYEKRLEASLIKNKPVLIMDDFVRLNYNSTIFDWVGDNYKRINFFGTCSVMIPND